jgi:hypothetical protein
MSVSNKHSSGLYYKNMGIVTDDQHEWCLFSSTTNDTSRVVRMMIIGDATTWSITSDDYRGVIYVRNIFIKQAAAYLAAASATTTTTKTFLKHWHLHFVDGRPDLNLRNAKWKVENWNKINQRKEF